MYNKQFKPQVQLHLLVALLHLLLSALFLEERYRLQVMLQLLLLEQWPMIQLWQHKQLTVEQLRPLLLQQEELFLLMVMLLLQVLLSEQTELVALLMELSNQVAHLLPQMFKLLFKDQATIKLNTLVQLNKKKLFKKR